MDRTEQTELTVLCMVYDGTRILLQNRVRQDWRGVTLPGGHVEPGEPFVEAAVREIGEETGLLVSHPILCGVKQFQTDSGTRYIVLLFKTDQFEGTVRGSEEGEVFWAERSELEHLHLAEDFMQLLKVFDDPNCQEFYYRRADGERDWQIELY